MRLPRPSSKLVTRWLALVLGASVLALLTGGWLADWTALAPHRIWSGEIWRLVTWAFVELGPYGLILTLAAIYKFGGELAPRWGDRRLRRFVLHVILASAITTVLLALLSRQAMFMSRTAGWAIGDALCIAWARQFPFAVLRVYGVLELSGQRLVGVTVAANALYAIAYGPFVMAPELVACLVAAFYPQAWLARR